MAETQARIVISARDNTQAAIAKARAGFSGLNAEAGRLSGAFAVMGRSITTALAGTGLALFFQRVIDGLDALNDLSDATGSSVENLSALEDVAARTGTTFDTVGQALTKFNQLLNSSKAGSEQERVLRAIGLSAEELRKQDPAEALRQTAVALERFENDGNKARITQELFGKSIREVAPFLKDLAEAGRLNATVTTQQAQEAEKFNRQLQEFKKNSTDAARTIASTLLPSVNKMLEDFKRAELGVIDFVAALNKIALLPIGGGLVQSLAKDLGRTSSELEQLEAQLQRMQQLQKLNPGAVRDESLRAIQARIDKLKTLEIAQQRVQQPFDPGAAVAAVAALKSPAPDISGGSAKAVRLPRFSVPENKALTDALNALERTDVAKLAALETQLEELFTLQRETRGAPAVVLAIQDTIEELDKLKAARITSAVIDPVELMKIEFLRSEKEAYEQITETVKEMDEFSLQAARNIQDTLGDTLARTLKGDFDSIGELWKNMLIDMVAQAVSARLGQALFGNFGSTGVVGGLLGPIFGGIPFFETGTDFVPRDTLAFVHRGERIIPAAENAKGGGRGEVFDFSIGSLQVGSDVSRAEVYAGFARMAELQEAKFRGLLARRGV